MKYLKKYKHFNENYKDKKFILVDTLSDEFQDLLETLKFRWLNKSYEHRKNLTKWEKEGLTFVYFPAHYDKNYVDYDYDWVLVKDKSRWIDARFETMKEFLNDKGIGEEWISAKKMNLL